MEYGYPFCFLFTIEVSPLVSCITVHTVVWTSLCQIMSGPAPPLDHSRTFLSVNKTSISSEQNNNRANESIVYRYTLTGLHDEEAQIQTWASFCANVFSYKANPPPPSYFARHYLNDPQRSHPSFIRVAYDNNNNELVASCRIFWKTLSDGSGRSGRTCSDNSKSLVAAGIGEVCTRQDHRRRGLSKQLLQDALEIIQSTNHADVCLLHAAPTFFPVYQSVGFEVGPESLWKVVPINVLDEASCDRDHHHRDSTAHQQGIHLRQAEFPKDTSDFMQLYQSYSENRFAGCIRRSSAYWNEYLSEELQGRLWVCCSNDKDSTTLGWMSIRSRGSGRYQLQDFGCSMDLLPTAKKEDNEQEPSSNTSLYMVFSFLLTKTLKQCGALSDESEPGAVQLHLPSSVFEEVQESFRQQQTMVGSGLRSSILNFDNASDENDGGWMYKPISKKAKAWLTNAVANKHPHLIWPADSF